ncbi:uncharacterized protein B0H64DRAFT_330262 [Chaetomium fimeti]|uniref:Protein kinase domain-containing protein n=1 Tax=Chaetomium fimeti TaxID=1854472 RepID=A0AAE0LNK7_9PEZI|nr:hypothetical protein B0H64DRAFT_330262 [Chaetomium fimeti]
MSDSFDHVKFLDFHNLTNETTEAYTAHYQYNNQVFSVLISTTPPDGYDSQGAIEFLWIERLWDLSSHHSNVHAQLLRQLDGELEIAREIQDVVFPMFEHLSSSSTPTASESDRIGNTVAEYLFPHRINLEVVTKEGKLEVLSGHHEDLDRARIAIPWSAVREAGVEPGSEVVGKLGRSMGEFRVSMKREIEIYGKLKKLDLHPEARFPEFKGEKHPRPAFTFLLSRSLMCFIGLITHNDDIVGFIVAKIPTKYPSLRPVIDGQGETALPALPLRMKWAAQIEQAVTELHRNGLVWGDAKPGNVVIDTDDNAWVLDFGGGGTDGWMEESTYQTEEGDLNAVAKMKEMLLRSDDAKGAAGL